ncbi:MAG: response regulator transcription factor [Defluviitaleaceae bacterium]|nr:response regulator transcription factor [Defluviitaleaceae bacterium]
MRNILLVEDNETIQTANSNMLKRRGGYNVLQAANLAEAREIVASTYLDVILLDIMLPDGSGLDLLRELKQEKDIPVLLLSALSEVDDRIAGLEAGGDAYMTKPYNNKELLLNIEAVLRRSGRMPEVIKKGNLQIKVTSDEALVNDVNLGLSQKEFSLLCYFEQNENKAMSGQHLYEKIWGQQMGKDNQALRSAVSRLRGKLKGSGYTIVSERGGSYRFEKGATG